MRIALMISSIYSESIDHSMELNNEVKTDSETVKTILHPCYEVFVPAGKLSPKQREIQLDAMQAVVERILNEYPENKDLYIVLNTHGIPGKHDIDNFLILKTIQLLSFQKINIRKMYALFCDAFSTYRQADDHASTHFFKRSLRCQSSVHILQESLSKLTTCTQQSFAIHGFEKPYDPLADHELIENLLRDTPGTGLFLSVTTVDQTAISEKEEQAIASALTTYRLHLKDPSTEAQSALDVLSSEIKRRSLNIEMYLRTNKKSHVDLSPRSLRLYQHVVSQKEEEPKSVMEYYLVQKEWGKSNAFKNEEGQPGSN